VQREPELLRPLVAAGALVQLTAASLDGRGGKSAERCAFRLLDLRLAHVLASDAHAPHVREVGFAGALAALGDPPLGRWLTDDVPKAIVGGLALPRRPGRPRLFGRLRGRTEPTRAQ
jgi:protein-tyrosine phosphatase